MEVMIAWAKEFGFHLFERFSSSSEFFVAVLVFFVFLKRRAAEGLNERNYRRALTDELYEWENRTDAQRTTILLVRLDEKLGKLVEFLRVCAAGVVAILSYFLVMAIK